MFDYQTVKLMHPHGNELFPMEEVQHHGPATHDPERRWLRGKRLFRCTRCPEEIVLPEPEERASAEER